MFVFDDRIQVIVPRTNFSCSGRITGYLISLERLNGEDLEDLPIIQVYRPSMESRESYIEEDRYTLSNNDITNMSDYHLANVSFIDNDRIEFQSDDVIGYFIPSESRYNIWNIETVGYTSYIDEGSRENTFSINIDTDAIEANRQPLIQVIFGKAVLGFMIDVMGWTSLLFEMYGYSYNFFFYFTKYQSETSFTIKLKDPFKLT